MKTLIPCKISYSQTDECWYVESPGIYDGYITYGRSQSEAKVMAGEAISGLLESYIEHGDNFTIPESDSQGEWHNVEIGPSLAFAIWLRRTRLENNMTLSEVAEKMGVKYQVYQKLENPKTANPTLKTLKKLERIFGQEIVAI